ncbi:CBASS cGAMP synthase [Desulfoferrobacter suflitae]|uniref:CBASS cGAMP synthase n=1 Tax=Desulfoferrobacter suflitae TaxID=2865782 RepID=UPI0021644745|nr:CBASS cGAMP synthase [Desulfoferrobacter suflitae]MCK8604375.1 nucleotidyltransferase [Desulfoferrobacter suflitae]
MADCSNNFKSGEDCYLSKISLSSQKEDQLRTSRDALREKIRAYLKEKGIKDTRFYRQGSYAHRTMISPLNCDYDIDDGVYMDLSDFKEEPSTRTIHTWILEAVENHTQTPPVDKEPCVRAIFKAGYQVDLPAYKIEERGDENENYFLAKKTSGWFESDPKAMTRWFQDQIKQKSEQLRRLVKYFKGWRDYRSTKNPTKLPSGLTLTILACEQYLSDPRDDISFTETARSILARLRLSDAIWKPYHPTENMRDYLSDRQFDHFINELEKLVATGDEAIEKKSAPKAAQKWQKVLGERFPVLEDPDEGSKAKKFEKPAIVGTTVRSA